jgi:maltose alpha-D-glucosyltransferase / alpha-amylase
MAQIFYTISLKQMISKNEDNNPMQNLLYYINILHKKCKIKYLHLQPFYESPFLDNGYDIKNHKKILKKFGSFFDFEKLVIKCKSLGIELVIDLVFNHISFTSEWFQKAIQGDVKYQKYFINSDKPHVFLYKRENEAFYINSDGNIYSKNIYMKKPNSDNPNWKKYGNLWYFHTFYDNQIDLDLTNPEVIKEIENIYFFWSKYNINYRFDALDIYHGPIDTISEKYHQNISENILRRLKNIDSRPKFIAECYNQNFVNIDSIDFVYDFITCEAIWQSFFLEDHSYIFENIKSQKNINKKIIFLRNHDELSFENLIHFLPVFIEKIKSIKSDINIRLFGGGISGTTLSLLYENSYYFEFLYSFLFSLPFSNILIPSGDEFMSKGEIIPDNMDSRFINRPNIYHYSSKIIELFDNLKKIKEKYFINFKYIQEYGKILKISYEKCDIYHNISNFPVKGSKTQSQLLMSVGNFEINSVNNILYIKIGPKSSLVFSNII